MSNDWYTLQKTLVPINRNSEKVVRIYGKISYDLIGGYAILKLMKLVYEDKNQRIIKGQEEITFSSLTSYHLINSKDFPIWATKETFKIKLGNIYFYELEK